MDGDVAVGKPDIGAQEAGEVAWCKTHWSRESERDQTAVVYGLNAMVYSWLRGGRAEGRTRGLSCSGGGGLELNGSHWDDCLFIRGGQAQQRLTIQVCEGDKSARSLDAVTRRRFRSERSSAFLGHDRKFDPLVVN